MITLDKGRVTDLNLLLNCYITFSYLVINIDANYSRQKTGYRLKSIIELLRLSCCIC